MPSTLRPALTLFVLLSILLGGAYPAAVAVAAQALFPRLAAGSLIEKDGKILGSRLIGQQFRSAKYFWGRPSATAQFPYNAASSGASNLSPANPALIEDVKGRIAVLRKADTDNENPVPADLATNSASGLDPHISPASAEYQISRVADAREMNEDEVRALVSRYTERRTFGILGEERVNVLMLNLELDGIKGIGDRGSVIQSDTRIRVPDPRPLTPDPR